MLIIGYNLNLSDHLHSLVIKDVSYKMYILGLGVGVPKIRDSIRQRSLGNRQ